MEKRIAPEINNIKFIKSRNNYGVLKTDKKSGFMSVIVCNTAPPLLHNMESTDLRKTPPCDL